MGWYLRKSVKLGPLRINLSKSGIGYSVGMRGLRVGRGPRGPYVAGGRYGLYFRQSLKSVLREPPTSVVVPSLSSATSGSRASSADTLGQLSYCTNCGAHLIPGNHFCIECGARCDLSMPSTGPTNHISFGTLALIGFGAATVFVLFKILLSML